jgi:hypothetical protein
MSRDLDDPTASSPVDLATQTYLSVDEALAYLRFRTRKALYAWADRQRIPKCRRGRTLLFLRRDLDEALQGLQTSRALRLAR